LFASRKRRRFIEPTGTQHKEDGVQSQYSLTNRCRDTGALYSAFTTMRQLRKEALSLSKTGLQGDDAHAAMKLLQKSHDLWRERLLDEILTEDTAAEMQKFVPHTQVDGPRTLAAACTLELAFLQSLVDAQGFCTAAKMQEFNAVRAENELEESGAPASSSAAQSGTYL
jgi:hypothetical protein